ncbi:MAG: polysaccharide deacetylase family protein [Bacillota bacterium]
MRIYYFPGKWWGIALLILVALAALPLIPWIGERICEVTVLLSGRIIPIYSVDMTEKKVAFSFDATWGAENTLKLLDILDRHKVKTTFFLAGFWVNKYPEMVREINRRGHELGNHSWTHPHMNSLNPEQITKEIMITHQKLSELGGSKPVLFRPPFGEYSNKVIEAADRCGYKTIMWSVDSLDWQNLSSDRMIQRVMRRIHPGAIILFHNAGPDTPQAVDELFGILIKGGYRIVPISDLLIKGEYYTDHTGKMKSKPLPAEPESKGGQQGQ